MKNFPITAVFSIVAVFAIVLSSGSVNAQDVCDGPYEPMGPKLFGSFYGGDNLLDVYCKLETMMSEDPDLQMDWGWGQQIPSRELALQNVPEQWCGDSYCIVKIGKLGDFGEELNDQYINLVDAPFGVEAYPFVINNIKFAAEFGFCNGGTNKYFYGYPLYKLKHGNRVTISGAQWHRAPDDAKGAYAVTMEILCDMTLTAKDDQNVIEHNAEELFAKFDNAFNDYEKRGGGGDVEYMKGMKRISLKMRGSSGVVITYNFDISPDDPSAYKAMNFYYDAEQKLLNKNEKKDSGDL